MAYVLIHWTDTNETSILTEDCVKDKSMLNNPEKEGIVMFADTSSKPPKTGWKFYLAKVLASSGKFILKYFGNIYVLLDVKRRLDVDFLS